MNEFSGKAGTIYIEKPKDTDDWKYEVWFEDLHMLGKGNSKLEALEDAGRNTIDILELIVQAKCEVAAVSTAAGTGD